MIVRVQRFKNKTKERIDQVTAVFIISIIRRQTLYAKLTGE